MTRTKRHTTGKASDYIVHLKKLLMSSRFLKVVLYCRVSRCWQSKNGNLEDQKRYLLRMIRKYEKKYHVKVEIVAVIFETASGWSSDRIELEIASLIAKEHNAILVAESSCRFVRSKRFHSNKKPDVLPTIYEYENLIRDTEGVTLATIIPPDKSWKRTKAYQAKRGQRIKRHKGGRPRKKYPGYKKQERVDKLPIVLRLHNKGKKVSYIAFKTGIKVDRVRVWIKRYSE